MTPTLPSLMTAKHYWISILIMGALVGIAFGFSSRSFGLGLAVGGGLMALNQIFLQRILQYGLLQGHFSKTQLLFLLMAKILLLFGVAWLCMKYIPMDLFGFGLGVVLMALIHALVSVWVKRAR